MLLARDSGICMVIDTTPASHELTHVARGDPALRALVQLAEQDPGITILWLYGSRARGTHRPASDYDLAVAFTDFIRDDPFECRLRPELLAMDWARALGLAAERLSVLDINQVGIPLAFQVIHCRPPLFCRDYRRLLTEERRIESRMELDIYPSLAKRDREHVGT
jgi:predicted nucleotidyltransferase